MEVSLFRRFYTYVHMPMQGMLNGTEQWCLVKGVAEFRRCPLVEVSLYVCVFLGESGMCIHTSSANMTSDSTVTLKLDLIDIS